MKNSVKKLLGITIATIFTVSTLAGCVSVDTTGDKGNKEKIYTIGISQFAQHPSLDNCREGFIEGLKQEGFIDGKNVKFDYQNAQTDMGIATSIAQKFVSKNYDLVCGIATPSAQSAYNEAQKKKIPVIFTAVSDPIGAGLINSFANPGKGATGTSDLIPAGKQLELIRTMLPNAKKIGILYNTNEVNSTAQIKLYEEAAPKYGFTIVKSGVSDQAAIALAVDSILTKVDCITNLTDNLIVENLGVLVGKANEKKIPVFGSEEEQVKNGCIASEGLDYFALGVQTGKQAAKVLKGENISTIPTEEIKQSSTFANKAVMDKLGIAEPASIKDKIKYIK